MRITEIDEGLINLWHDAAQGYLQVSVLHWGETDQWCSNKIAGLIGQNKARNTDNEQVLCPFRCWEPYFCEAQGRSGCIFPWHTAQIVSMQRFFFAPIPCFISFFVTNKTKYLLQSHWYVISFIMCTSEQHRVFHQVTLLQLFMPTYGLPKA